MGIFSRNDKGVDCTDDPENPGSKTCRVILRKNNNLLATGSSFGVYLDQKTSKAGLIGRSTILEEDEAEVQKALRQIETQCKGTGGIN